MEKLGKILFMGEKDFPREFKGMIPCLKSSSHDWFIDLLVKEDDFRLFNIECKNCKKNLTETLRFFAGIQDHG
jgi:hypothetical protein